MVQVRLAGLRDCDPYLLAGCGLWGAELGGVWKGHTQCESHRQTAGETVAQLSSPKEEFDAWNALYGRQT